MKTPEVVMKVRDLIERLRSFGDDADVNLRIGGKDQSYNVQSGDASSVVIAPVEDSENVESGEQKTG